MINLDEHKIYVESHKMDMVPYTIVVKAIEEMQKAYEATAINKIEDTISNTLSALENTFTKLNETISEIPSIEDNFKIEENND